MATSLYKPSSKLSKSPSSQSQSLPSPSPKPSSSSSSSSSLSTHLAMVELKSKVLAALSKLSDRDTQQIAIDELERIIRTLPSDGVPMLLGSLTHEPPAPPPPPVAVRRESLRLVAALCAAHPDAAAAHLPKIVAHLVRRLKDPASDSSVRDACRDSAGALSAIYLRPLAAAAEGGGGAGAGSSSSSSSSSVVALFVKPLFEAMGEQNKAAQAGAAACLAKVVECANPEAAEASAGAGAGASAGAGAGALFAKLCPRICKMLSAQSFLAKGALLSVVSSLAQSSDWATRKAAADTLCILSSHSSHLVGDGATSIITSLESCRFDKVKPVRDSMAEALQLWKKSTGEDATSEDPKDGKSSESADNEERLDSNRPNASTKKSEFVKDASPASPPTTSDSAPKGKGANISEKAAVLLKKKVPSLTDKELNPEFFQNLETRTNDLAVEVVVPRKYLQTQGGDEPDRDYKVQENQDGSMDRDLNQSQVANNQSSEKRFFNKMQIADDYSRDKWTEQRGFRGRDLKARMGDVDDKNETNQRDSSSGRLNISRSDGQANWLAIQRQLSQLERQQTSLMNMLQDFMGGSHDSMVTLENRVRGLERIVEEMARDLTLSSGRRSNLLMGFESPPGRSSSKYNGFHEYSSSKFGRGGDGRLGFAERFLSPDGIRGRDPSWRSESEAWDSYSYSGSRNGAMSSRRGLGAAIPRTERDGDIISNRRAWDKGQGPFRLGEGPSARSAWQASKDEATLEAIRVAGEDNGNSRVSTRAAIPELDGEALTDDNNLGQERGPLWAMWTRAMDSLHVGDVDSAYAEILSGGDAMLLVKLMEQTGPVIDQLSSDVANEVLHAAGQFLLEESFFDIALTWLQQLTDLVVENGSDLLGIPIEGKREILLSLHEASAVELPEDWEGATPEQIMTQLASSWGINLQKLIN
ncbi:Microtubule-associated protein TORTIFOLIA1 [Ananas comosus]|uniref:Microtubule-associated protein TORTIFOLIA1 n=1 Tax=Ananas comosus TaxID=4615 RepID=A0A199URQ4_ANACO|nr:Microtubule-associated protein TORTIFOLIA1 [Ananas comosus]